MNTINMFKYEFRNAFVVRLFSNVIFYRRNKKNSKNGQLCTKITNFCIKTFGTKSNEDIKKSDTKISFNLI